MTAGGSSSRLRRPPHTLCFRWRHRCLAHEVHQVGAQQQQLRHPCIVISASRYVAIGAAFGFLSPDRMRNKRAEGLSAEALRRNGLLLVIIQSRSAFCELTRMAQAERTGATRCPVTVPSMPRLYTSSRRTWKLYDVQLRVRVPSLCSMGMR